MMKSVSHNRMHQAEALIHVIGWGLVLAFPLLMLSRNASHITWNLYFRHASVLLAFCAVFYLNYLWLIPHYLFKERTKEFLLLNVLVIVCMSFGLQTWQDFLFAPPPPRVEEPAASLAEREPPFGPPKIGFYIRDVFSMILTAGLSVAIRLSIRWTQIESVRREAEKSRTEAELKNLRSQLNPHFLLNTLNNIYALIAFDTDKAQCAVQELSKLLRHVLYDNQQERVPLSKEMDFIRNYIELMRIRVAANVDVTTDIDVHPDSHTGIAPLIFISLIENAFKHGISPMMPSYIRIHFRETADEVRCLIVNSHHPKSELDKSGSGIGLEQVRKRLELTYPGRYTWQHGVSGDGKEYRSELVIQTV